MTVDDAKLWRIDMIRIADLPTFDMAEQLRDAEDIAACLQLALDDEDPAELAHALGIIVRARGMTEIAKKSDMSREALYKALRPGSGPALCHHQQSHESTRACLPIHGNKLILLGICKYSKNWYFYLKINELYPIVNNP